MGYSQAMDMFLIAAAAITNEMFSYSNIVRVELLS